VAPGTGLERAAIPAAGVRREPGAMIGAIGEPST
jgi:hypothetical protein